MAEEGEFAVTVPGGNSAPAQLVGRDPTTDVALLRIDRSDLQPLPLAATSLAVGALAIAVGSDDGAPIAALGVVSRAGGPWRSLRGGEIDARIELDLRLRRSAEGGVALDASGAAFGMAVFGPRRRVLVIPAATIERVAAKLASDGRIPRGYLGLGLHPVALTGGDGAGRDGDERRPERPGRGGRRPSGRRHRRLERRADPACPVAAEGIGAGSRGADGHAGPASRGRDEAALADRRRKARRLSDEDTAQPIRLALAVADGALADRLAAVLAGVPGLRLVGMGDAADAIIVAATGAVQRANEDLAPALRDAAAARSPPADVSLTPRELEVLVLLAEGASNKTIARRLAISVHTAKFHVASVIDKLDAIGRTDAVAHAARLGIINL